MNLRLCELCAGAKDFVFIDYEELESCYKAVDSMNGKTFDEHSRGVMKVFSAIPIDILFTCQNRSCLELIAPVKLGTGVGCEAICTAATRASWWQVSFSGARSTASGLGAAALAFTHATSTRARRSRLAFAFTILVT